MGSVAGQLRKLAPKVCIAPNCVVTTRRSARRRLLVMGLTAVTLIVGLASEAAADEATAVDLGIQAKSVVRDVGRDVVYASVSQDDTGYANKVVKINPASGAIIDSVNVGSDPGKLALADDGSYLYVALDGASKVIRINLATFAVDLEIPIAPVKARAAFAGDIAVMPGQPTTIAVARRFQGLSPPGAGVAIYDGAVMRADTTPDHIGEDSIVFGSATTLYGSDLCCSGNEFYVVDITATGATRALKVSGLGGQPLELFRNDRVFGSRGRVVDVSGATPVIDGTLATETMLTGGIGALDYLASNSRVYLAGTTGAGILIEQFNPDTYVKTRTFTVEPGFDDPIDLAVLGEDSFMVVARPSFGVNQLLRVQGAGSIQGSVTDRHTGERVGGICVDVSLFGDPDTIVASTTTNTADPFSIALAPGTYQVSYIDCQRWDYAAEWYGTDSIEQIDVTSGAATDASFALTTGAMTGLVDIRTGLWYLSAPRTDFVQSFYYGNPGDLPMTGDWNCDGVDTPGLYRQSDGFVYLRNSNTQGVADIRFFFGNPGDVPLAGDFNGDGCDTVSIYRPSQSRVFVINVLGENDGGLGSAETDYYFGNPGDKPFVGDFDLDGIDTIGLHRESTGLVYFRNSHTQGNADVQYVFGNPGDRLVAGNFSGFWVETPAVFRPSNLTFYIRHTNTQGNADRSETWDFAEPHWQPIAGVFGLTPNALMSQSQDRPLERSP